MMERYFHLTAVELKPDHSLAFLILFTDFFTLVLQVVSFEKADCFVLQTLLSHWPYKRMYTAW